ncbi:MAG TPA: CvpA family protein [Terracidiphilus sp.]|nr:CvpA family protein [Terracidiphilus sp.]
MTLVDWIIVVILASTVLGGLAQGFLRSVFSLGGLILGLILAAWNYRWAAAVMHPFIHNARVADTISFLLIAIVVAVVASILGSLLSKMFHKMGLGCLDRLAGALFGLFQGALIVTVCILVTVAFFPRAEWLTRSRLPKYFFGACHFSTHISPEKLAERVRQELKTLETNSPQWMHPAKKGA